jgi:hypothetical protein
MSALDDVDARVAQLMRDTCEEAGHEIAESEV